jgi:hypothetical protein
MLARQPTACQAEVCAQLPRESGQEVGGTHIWEQPYATLGHRKDCPAHGSAPLSSSAHAPPECQPRRGIL